MAIPSASTRRPTLLDWANHPPQPLHANSSSFPLKLTTFPDLQEQIDESKQPQEKMVLGVVVNFLAGGLATGGVEPLDGMQPIQNFKTWEWVLQQLLTSSLSVDKNKIKNLLSQIQVLLKQSTDQKKLFNRFSKEEFLAMVNTSAEALQNLKIGESYPIYGGWGNIAGGSGHALIYEVRRSNAKIFEFRVYTATDFQLAENLLWGDKRRLLPVVCWEQIPEDYLFAKTASGDPPVFIQHLFEMGHAISKYDMNTILDEADILEALDYLAPFKQSVTHQDFGAETGQRGGTCLPSSTKTWARYHFDTLQEYKIFKFYFDFILMTAAYHELGPHLAGARTTLTYAAQALVSAADKSVNGIPPEIAFEATKQLREWITGLEKISKDLEIEQKQKTNPVNIKTQKSAPQLEQRTKDRFWIKQSQYCDNAAPSPCSFPSYVTLHNSNYLLLLEETYKVYQEKLEEKNKFASRQAATLSLHHAIDQLPINETNSSWENLDADSLGKCCTTLRMMAVTYLQDTATTDLPPRRFATLFTIYATLHHLACLIHRKKGRSGEPAFISYSIPFYADRLNQMETLTFHNFKEFERIEKAKAYFKKFEGKPPIFESEIETNVVKESIHKSPHNADLWEDLLRSNEPFQQAVDKKAGERFREYTDIEIDADFENQRKNVENWYGEEKAHYEKSQHHSSYLRPKPSEARKLQNLPLLTKRMLLLEEFDSNGPLMGNPLLATDYQEINELRLISHLVKGAISTPRGSSSTLKRTADRDPDHHDIKCKVLSYAFEDKFSADSWDYYIQQHQYLQSYAHQKFFELPQAKRNRNNWDRKTAEARALDQKELSPLLHQLLRTLSEWRLAPHQLLLEFGKDFEHLKDPEVQVLFLRLFFRSPYHGTKVHLGAGELTHNPDLLENIKAFVAQGLSYFGQLKQKEGKSYGMDDVEGVKFLFEFNFLCQKYLIDQNKTDLAKQLDVTETLNRWIEDNKISRKPRALLRLYRLLHISLAIPIEKLKLENLQQIFLDWAVIHLYSEGYRPAQVSPLVFCFADHFIADTLTKHRESLEKNYPLICRSILKEVEGIEQQIAWKNEASYPIFQGTTQTQEIYRIDLRQGEVFTPKGKATRVILSRSWEDDPDFKRIFWNHPSFEYTMGGKGAVTFSHPTLGFFQILLARYHKKTLIQKQWGGEWYQYIPPDQVKKESIGLSAAFVKDHALWGQVKVEQLEMVEIPRPSQTNRDHTPGFIQLSFRTLRGKGIYVELDPNKTLQEQTHLFEEQLPGIPEVRVILAGRVISPNQRIVDAGFSNKETVVHLLEHLPTYSSENVLKLGTPVLAKNDGPAPPPPVNLHPFKGIITSLETGQPVWAIDEKEGKVFEVLESQTTGVAPLSRAISTYYLDSNDHGLAHFEDPDYILTVLDSKDTTERLHFPRLRSQDGNPLSFIKDKKTSRLVWSDNQQYCLATTAQGFFRSDVQYLYLTAPTPKDPAILLVRFIPFLQKEKARKPEDWGSIPYFEYQIENDLITPQSTEGKFHLAYLYFQDKKYALAIEQINRIDPIDTVSPLGFFILERIQKKAPPIDHPDAAMVPLQAALRMIEERDRQSAEPVDSYFGSSKEDIQDLHNLVILAHESLQSLNHISEECNLPLQEKERLFQTFVKEAQAKKILSDKFRIEYPQGSIDHLRYWLTNPSTFQRIPKGHREVPKNRNTKNLQTLSLDLPSLYRQAHESEELSKTRFETECRRTTLWLTSGTLPFLVNRWPLEGSGGPKENGKLLEAVLEIARKGTSQQRLAMLWKVRNWRLHWKGNEEHLPSFDLMVCILMEPHRFPDAIPESATFTEKVEFLKKIDRQQGLIKGSFNNRIEDYLNSHKKISSPSRRQERYTLPSLSSWYHQKEPALKDFGPVAEPLLQEVQGVVKGNYDQLRLTKLKEWKDNFFAPYVIQNKEPPIQFRFELKKGLLSKQEEAHQESVQKDMDILGVDFEEGVRQLENQEEITLTHADDLLDALQNTKKTTLEALGEKEEKAKKILNQLPLPFKEFIHRIAQNATGVKKNISLDKARDALRTFDKRAFKVLNPTLTDEQITEVAKLLIDIEDLKSWHLQLGRMEELVTKGKALIDPEDLTKRDICRRLLLELKAAYHFNTQSPKNQVIYRIYCGEIGIIPFEKQVNLITEMLKRHKDDPRRLEDCVYQLIMGGGKTDVIAPLLMQFIAREAEQIALYIVPAALLKVVSNNLTASLKKAFNQKLELIHIKRDDLTLYRLKRIEKLLIEARETPLAIIMPPSSLVIFELEFLSQARKLKSHLIELKTCSEELQSTREKNRARLLQNQINRLTTLIKERGEKIELLARIVMITTENGHALIDEVDLILDALIEINFPDGVKIPIALECNHLVYTIFSLCMQDDLRLEALPGKPLIREALNLDLLKQKSLPLVGDEQQALYERYEQAKLILADRLTTTFALFQTLPQQLRPSLIRFLTEKIPYCVQKFADEENLNFTEADLAQEDPDWKNFGTIVELRSDCHFLKLLNDRLHSQNKQEHQFAKLVGLANHLLNDILPATLWKIPLRHFGPVPRDPDGKLCPYNGVRSPVIEREFGYVWEEICYYYKWACLSAPEDAVILQLAKLATAAARYYMKKNGELFEQTAEYLQFKKLTSVSLQDFQDPTSPLCKEGLKKTRSALEKNPKNRLLLQKELTALQVKMHPYHLSGNGLSLCRRVLSRLTMTGTPWNVQGYRQSLANRFFPDKGTEGKVLATLIKKVTPKHLHKATLTPNIGDLFRHVLKNSPNSKKHRGFIEAGGLLDICPENRIVASQILAVLEEEKQKGNIDPDIDTILFFGREGEDAEANTLYMWKMGTLSPEKIGATKQQALKAKGLDPRNYFVFYPERQTTGTDILQVPEAVNLFSFDPKMLLRTIPQGGMRLRQLLFSQSIEGVMNENSLADIFNRGKSMGDLILHAAKNQSLRKTHDMPRYFKMQINDPPRYYAVEKLLHFFIKKSWDQETFLSLMDKGEPYFVQTLEDNLGQFCRVKRKEDSKVVLKDRLDRLNENYPYPSPALTQEVEALKKHIDQAPLPPYIETARGNIGTENEVEAAVEVDVNVEQEQQKAVEVDEDIERELQLYENIERSEYLPDQPITHDQFLDLIAELASKKTNLTSLSDQLKKFKYGLQNKQKQYEKIFSEPVYGTECYFNSCKSTLPVFHALQRPPTQILAVKGVEGIKWLLVSEHESHSIKAHLITHPEMKNVWLIQPNGSPLAPSTDPFPLNEDDDDVLRGLVEINVFNGNADWLGYYEHYLAPWLVGDFELKLDFLKLRTARHPHQRQILAYLPSILKMTEGHQHVDLKSNVMLFSERAERELLRVGNAFTPGSPVETKLLRSMKQIEQLAPTSIPDLGIDPTQTDLSTQEALKTFKARHPNTPENEIPRLIELHSKNQIKYIPHSKVQHLSYAQMKWIHLDQVPHLEYSHQIMHKIGDKTAYLLNEEQVKRLSSEQGHLIPSINPLYYPQLTDPRHIENVPPGHLESLDPKYACYFTSRQIKEGIKTLQFLKKCNFLPTQWSDVHGNWIEGIPSDMVTPTHIQEITDSKTLQSLQTLAKTPEIAHQWARWLTKTQIPHLLPEQTPLIPFLNPDCYPHLIHSEHIQAIPPNQVDKITLEQAKHLLPAQITHLQPRQADLIPLLNPDYYLHLTYREHIQKISPDHIDKIAHIRKDDLLPTQIKQGIKTLDFLKSYNLPATQWENVHGNLVRGIPPEKVTKAQIQEIQDTSVIQSLDQIAKDHFPRWVGWLGDTQVVQIQNPRLIQSLSFWQELRLITPEQLKRRTLLQRKIHIVALYFLGYIAKIILWTPIANSLKVKTVCQQLSSRLDKILNCSKNLEAV